MPRPEERAASEVVGAVILFGFLVITFSIYQGVVVPNQNRGVEFEHNQAVQDSIQDLRNAIRQTATTGAEESVSITLGASYPQRVIAVNPGASAGAIGTESLPPITIHNVSAKGPETRDYIGKNTTTLGAFESRGVVYSPVYFQYTEAPVTRYENTLAYNQFPGGVNLTITDQAVIDDRRITLVAINGSLSAARQGTVTVDTTALSTATNTVSVSNQTDPINVTFGTRLTAANWTDLLETELTPDGHVTEVKDTGPNQVSIVLEPGTYELRLARVGVGTDTTATTAKYVVDAEGDNTSVAENGTQRLVAEVRDRYNNPAGNVTVTAATPGQGSLDSLTATTDSDGQATFLYTAPSNVDGATDLDIEMSFSGGGDANRTVTFDVRVLDADGSGGDDGGGVSEVNPSGEDKLVLQQVSGTNTEAADLTFNNTASEEFVVVAIRAPFYFEESGGQDETTAIESFAGVDTFEGAEQLAIGASLTDLDSTVSFPADTTTTVTIEFAGDGNNLKTEGDFVILVLQLDSGATLTYFVAPQ